MNPSKAMKTYEIVKNGLCMGCGTCLGVCPNDAVKMVKNDSKGVYMPKLNTEKCKECYTCFKVCPGYHINFEELNLEIFGKAAEDALIGNFINCYIGHATNYEIRYNSASGGLVTALLIFALEEGIINGALVTKMSEKNPLEPESFIARTREEVIEASKSKYCPVPANLSLRDILIENGKFAVVGLPCHIHGVRKAEKYNKKLKEKIILHLGIFCSHPPTFLGTEYLLKNMSIHKEDVSKIEYRGRGWPGEMSIILKNGDTKFIPYVDAWNMMTYFYSRRCMLCCDQNAELADISFGDAWLPELLNDKIGKSIVISRNKMSEEILQRAVSKKIIKINRVRSEEVKQRALYFKKQSFNVYSSLFSLFGKKVPIYNTKLLKPTMRTYLRCFFLYLVTYISSKRYLWYLLNILIMLSKQGSYCKSKLEKIINKDRR